MTAISGVRDVLPAVPLHEMNNMHLLCQFGANE